MKKLFSLFALYSLFYSHNSFSADAISKIAFGSCLRQTQPQPIWQSIIAEQPDLFVFMGDNIYADTTDPIVMQEKYDVLYKQPGYQKLLDAMPLYATWDDHDYGMNDVGAENPIKRESEQLFLDFYQLPADSPARSRPGIYQSYYFGEHGQRVQLILLDTRYFRGPAVKQKPTKKCPAFNYAQQLDPSVSLLGDSQWQWLSAELENRADIRIIVSSIQVIPDQHCWEKWANFPLERDRLFNLIADKNADAVIFLSGDRHLSEVSSIKHEKIGYPILEVTSSGMNTKMYGKGEVNAFRMSEDNIRENNYGVIEFNWDQPSPSLTITIHNRTGKILFNHDILITDLYSNQ